MKNKQKLALAILVATFALAFIILMFVGGDNQVKQIATDAEILSEAVAIHKTYLQLKTLGYQGQDLDISVKASSLHLWSQPKFNWVINKGDNTGQYLSLDNLLQIQCPQEKSGVYRCQANQQGDFSFFYNLEASLHY
jgi:hypothetical protein